MKVASFYRFVDVANARGLRDDLLARCKSVALRGTILVANEGFNATLAGSPAAISSVISWIEDRLGLDEPVDARWTEARGTPFRHMRVRLRREIVTLGRPDLLPQERSGTYVEPADWNGLIDDPEVLVIDTRNRYEIGLGTFPRAVDPGTDRFSDFTSFAEKLRQQAPDKPLAMFCTGGIRCEKATALMLELGYDEVYQLKGGILNYLENVTGQDSRWNGECFVFDTRVAVDRDLAEGAYVQCHACRRPLSTDDVRSPDYRAGVSCPYCVAGLSAERSLRLEERQRQVKLARGRGDVHIGPRDS